MKTEMNAVAVERMACTAYEAGRGYGLACGEVGRNTWQIAPVKQQEAYRSQVRAVLENRGKSAAQIHDAWCEAKRVQGWTAGSVVDVDAKTDPWLVRFEELEPEQRFGYELVKGVVEAWMAVWGGE